MNQKYKQMLLYGCILSVLVILCGMTFQSIEKMCKQRTPVSPAPSTQKLMAQVEEELIFFPVAMDETAQYTISFQDSWMLERTFGGDRRHEGCDLMQSPDKRGILPVISMSDGRIEKIGWLKLGGYRVGIRSKNHMYYYYAHLNDYAPNLYEGKKIHAGELLGFVGDSGYSNIEGTTGNFPVHLHIGIYETIDGEESAINPYPYLKKLEQKQYEFSLIRNVL